MGSTSSSQTETNPVLAGGLALVGLLGVAAALLPADLLPVSQGAATETGQAQGSDAAAQSTSAQAPAPAAPEVPGDSPQPPVRQPYAPQPQSYPPQGTR